eukprot:286604_1
MSTVIGLVIILMQINTLTCYLDQYIIYEQRFISQPHYINDAAAWNDNITGVYQINNKLMNAKRLDELRTRWSQFDGEDFNFNEVACYNNSKGSQLFVTKSSNNNKYYFFLENRYANETWWRWSDSFLEDLFIYESKKEYIEITGNITKIPKAVQEFQQQMEQKIIDTKKYCDKLYPYYPDEYKVEVYLLTGAKVANETIEGIYKRVLFELSNDTVQFLKDTWGYKKLPRVKTYIHCDDSDSMIHITATLDKRQYRSILVTDKRWRAHRNVRSSSLWVYDDADGYQIA